MAPAEAIALAQPAGPGGSASSEPRRPATVAVLVAIGLYVALPGRIISASHGSTIVRLVVPALELALLIPLAVAAPRRHVSESGRRRVAAIALTATVTAAGAVALGLLVHFLLAGGHAVDGGRLLLAGAQLWWTNVIIFALWFWELDGGGPPARLRSPAGRRDFAFVQPGGSGVELPARPPRFADYLSLSFANASVFSPAETFPTTGVAKWLMRAQSTASLLLLLLVAARAVSILG